MKDSVLSALAALKGASAPALKAKWRELFESEPPQYNRRFLESRLAYRIQELAYGGLSRETLERLRAMAKQYDNKSATERKARPVHRPIAGTQLIREWQGISHCVTVRTDDFEWLGVLWPEEPSGSVMRSGRSNSSDGESGIDRSQRSIASGASQPVVRKLR